MFKNFVYIRLVVKYSFCSYVPDATLDSLIPHSIFYVKQINSFFSKIAAGSSMGLLQRVSNSSGLFGLGVQLFELWGLSRMPKGSELRRPGYVCVFCAFGSGGKPQESCLPCT